MSDKKMLRDLYVAKSFEAEEHRRKIKRMKARYAALDASERAMQAAYDDMRRDRDHYRNQPERLAVERAEAARQNLVEARRLFEHNPDPIEPAALLAFIESLLSNWGELPKDKEKGEN